MNELEASVLVLIQKIIAFAVVLQAIELLSIRHLVSPKGIWRWKTIRRDFEELPNVFLKILDVLMDAPGFLVILYLQLTSAIACMFFDFSLLSWSLFILVLLTSLRFGGSFNGGSDSMTLLVLGCVAIGLTFRDSLIIVKCCLGYIAIQACLSYFKAGWAKVGSNDWRRGTALVHFLNSACYNPPKILMKIFSVRSIAVALSWGIILFECLFPFVFVAVDICLVFLLLGIVFHMLNAYFLGLNRFVWAWLATYPALIYCSGLGTNNMFFR